MSLQKRQEITNLKIVTEIRELTNFYLAEDYHQKYYLRQYREIYREYLQYYPDWQDFTNSSAVTKVNGFVGGNSNPDELQKISQYLGLSKSALEKLAGIVEAYY